MVRVAEAEQAEPTPEETLIQRVRAFVRLKNTVKALTEEQNKLRDDLAALVASGGDVDEDGNQWFNLPTEVEGIASLKRERRVAQTLDMNEAERILKEKGLYDQCITMQPTLDEAALMQAVADDLITDEDLDAMFPKKISYAFVPQKKAY